MMIGNYAKFWNIKPEDVLKMPFYLFNTFAEFAADSMEKEQEENLRLQSEIASSRNRR